MALQERVVVAVKDFGGILREPIPAGTRGQVESAPWLAPARVTFDLYDFWRGHRKVTVEEALTRSPRSARQVACGRGSQRTTEQPVTVRKINSAA
jgi:hypothetical protein